MDKTLKKDKNLKSSQSKNVCEDPTEPLASVKDRCPLCYVFRASFYCENCISQGNFVSTLDPAQVIFSERKNELEKLLEKKAEVANMCRTILERSSEMDLLPEEISACSERIKTLKYLIQQKRDSIEKKQAGIQSARESNKTREKRLARYRDRVDTLASYVRHNMLSECQERRTTLTDKKALLKKLVQKNIEQLVKYIFPIEKINPSGKSMNEEESEIVSALAEASKTSFVRGTWVLMDSSGELHHRIVAPTLPGSGDYSAYLAVDNEGMPMTDQIGQNEAYNMGAALCYTTQLVSLLAFYLDVILPKKVAYADFCIRDLTERQFQRKVAWLNTNVLYLCFSQGMDSVLLHPRHTLNNLLNLVQHADLGQTGPFTVDSGLILSLECDEELRDEGSDEEEGDGERWEWEAIPLVPCPESTPGSMITTQQSASIAGGLVTSLASMFRGWSK